MDEVIKSLTNPKNIKTKIQKIFDELFRNISIPKDIENLFSKLGVDPNEIKDIKNFIRKN